MVKTSFKITFAWVVSIIETHADYSSVKCLNLVSLKSEVLNCFTFSFGLHFIFSTRMQHTL
jgi:hypothetical protein